MQLALYDRLTPWYRLLDPTADHADEAADMIAALQRGVRGPARTLLELGAGAGNNAWFFRQHFECTLTDVSEPMLALSRELNPECQHLLGDMRTLRLGRQFDAVVVHDAICYMTTEAELASVIATAFEHTRPGGAAVIAPDVVRESFREAHSTCEGTEESRSMRCLEWMWDPDPTDTTYCVDYAFLLRDETGMQAVHDHHVEGLFPRATWLRLLGEAGFDFESVPREADDIYLDEIFLGRRP